MSKTIDLVFYADKYLYEVFYAAGIEVPDFIKKYKDEIWIRVDIENETVKVIKHG